MCRHKLFQASRALLPVQPGTGSGPQRGKDRNNKSGTGNGGGMPPAWKKVRSGRRIHGCEMCSGRDFYKKSITLKGKSALQYILTK